MFRNTARVDAPAEIEQGDSPGNHDADLVPLSHLALDLDRPAGGWPTFLGARGIAIIADDLGRDAIPRQAARRLLDEKREDEVRQAALRRLAEQQAVEADRQRRAQIWGGIPADHLPVGVAPAAVMLQAAKDAQPRRESVLQQALGNSGELVFHPIQSEGNES